jgi:polyphosphate kinase
VVRATQTFKRDVRPGLKEGGFQIVDWGDFKKGQREELTEAFEERVCPVLTPLAVDLAHPFPYIFDLCLNLAVVSENPRRRSASSSRRS